MRTSLIETRSIEHFLLRNGEADDRLVFEARVLLDPALAERVEWQSKTMALVEEYARRELRDEIARVDQKMFRDPDHRGFRKKILSYFK